jgi:hypothetical protein
MPINTIIVMMMIRNNGIGNDRAMPVLNVGWMNEILVMLFWS